MIWLFIEASLKITKLRSLPVLHSYLEQGLVFYCAFYGYLRSWYKGGRQTNRAKMEEY